jgi:hypothetical protein
MYKAYKMFKKIISFALVLCMVMQTVNISIYATEQDSFQMGDVEPSSHHQTDKMLISGGEDIPQDYLIDLSEGIDYAETMTGVDNIEFSFKITPLNVFNNQESHSGIGIQLLPDSLTDKNDWYNYNNPIFLSLEQSGNIVWIVDGYGIDLGQWNIGETYEVTFFIDYVAGLIHVDVTGQNTNACYSNDIPQSVFNITKTNPIRYLGVSI